MDRRRRTLPQSLRDLTGRRAALWVRESTAGQFDAFGPDAQREQYDQALARWGLVDTGIAWSVAHSGWKIARHPSWHDMLGQAGATFDVLVVGYASRFARSLEAHVDARRAFHAAGAAILFADEDVLTSDEDTWERWAREAVESETYSRKLSKRVKEGLAAKRRRLGEPGGQPPYGFRREGRPPVLVAIPERIDDVVRVFTASAAGMTDTEVASLVELPLFTVRGILTNPFYVGRLRDGSPARVGALIDPALWNAAANRRAKRATNAGRPAHPSRPYGLGQLVVCAECEAPLMGDTGKYRHRDTCQAFQQAVHGSRRASAGRSASVQADWLDGVAEEVLGRVALRADRIAAVVTELHAGGDVADAVTLTRIERERTAAMDRYRRDRDTAALERTMASLDAQEQAARVAAPDMRPDEIVSYLRDLPALWREAPDTRRRIAGSLFDRVRVMGHEDVWFDPSALAVSLGIVDGMPASWRGSGGYGRGERASALTIHLTGRRRRLRMARTA